MKRTFKTFVCDATIDDAMSICDQLDVGIWAVEAGYNPVPAHDPDCVPAWCGLSDGIALSVTSATALRLTLGPALMLCLNKQGRFVDPLASLALHELIVNAAVHGNLGIHPKSLNIWNDLAKKEAAIVAARESPFLCKRLVTIALGWTDDRVVAIISDEGNGYEREDPPIPNLGSGRGLRIARAVGLVDVLSGGRQTVLTMACQVPEADC